MIFHFTQEESERFLFHSDFLNYFFLKFAKTSSEEISSPDSCFFFINQC